MKMRCNSWRKVSIPLIVCSLRWCSKSIRQVHCRLLYLKGVHLKQKIEVQKRFFSTKRRTQKRNIMLENPTKEERMEMIENWKNNEQSEQNNSKVPVGFTSGETMAHKACYASLFEMFSSLPITHVSPHHLFISLV